MMSTARALVLVAVTLLAAANLLQLAARISPPPTVAVPDFMVDYVTRGERRFAPFLAGARQRGLTGKIGYLEDAARPGATEFLGDSALAQYVVLPLVLDPDLARNTWALANRYRSSPQDPPDGWRIAEDFGDGVLLLARSAP